ncbi:MAG: glycoside hydrolase family 43 C-terminal domain-containing protein [Armatimonadota bacterium]
MWRTLSLVVALTALILSAGCGGGAESAVSAERGEMESSQIAGTWQISSSVTTVMTEIVFRKQTTDSLTLTFNPDGTLEAAERRRGQVVATSEGTWSVSRDGVQARWAACDATLNGRLFGNTLILWANDGTPDRIEMHFYRVE